jgi:hypothetical protein
MRVPALLILSCTLVVAAPLAWSIPGDTLGDAASGPAAAPSAQDTSTYNEALALMKKGDALGAQPGAHDAYSSARAKLQSLVGRSPQFAEAWNSLGYTQPRLL